MDILGHSEIAMTMDTYAHVVPELQRDAANRMVAMLAQPKTPNELDRQQSFRAER
jgi:hypothetical protein